MSTAFPKTMFGFFSSCLLALLPLTTSFMPAFATTKEENSIQTPHSDKPLFLQGPYSYGGLRVKTDVTLRIDPGQSILYADWGAGRESSTISPGKPLKDVWWFIYKGATRVGYILANITIKPLSLIPSSVEPYDIHFHIEIININEPYQNKGYGGIALETWLRGLRTDPYLRGKKVVITLETISHKKWLTPFYKKFGFDLLEGQPDFRKALAVHYKDSMHVFLDDIKFPKTEEHATRVIQKAWRHHKKRSQRP